jgi:hypothetical protein
MKLLAELKRRNVIRVAGLYLVGAWLVTQVASTVFPAFDLPGWALRGVILLLAIGFVPALIFAWVFELTPDGLKRDDVVTGDESFAPQTARRIDRMIIVVLLLALGYFAVDKFLIHRDRPPEVAAASTPTQSQPPAAIDRRSIAVLPFENLSGDADNAYFVAGIQDLILTNLSKIRGLKVISRNSVAQYASHPEDLLRAAFAEFVALIGPMDDYGKRLAAASAQALPGDERAALDWVQRALATVPPEQHAMHGARALGGAARVYAVLGRIDLMLPALARLRTLPAAGDAIWANRIRLDPTFRLVRDDPRVRAEIELLAGLER